MTEEGKKFDQEKARLELLPPLALEEIAKVLTFGTKKYADHNWAKGLKWSRLAGQEACSYLNLRPMWSIENLKKSNKM